MDTTRTAVGVFDNPDRAREAVSALRAAGFPEDMVGVIMKLDVGRHPHTHWEEGAEVGAATGAVTGLGLGLAVAAGAIPGVGPAIAGGTLMALLASAGAGAATGTVIGGLVGNGVSDEDAAFYDGEFTAGKTLVTVRAGERFEEACAILRRHGGECRDESLATYGNDLPATPY
jgi:hypothetical protein